MSFVTADSFSELFGDGEVMKADDALCCWPRDKMDKLLSI